MDLVLDTIEAGHEQRGVAEVGVGHRVGETEFHALCLGAGPIGDAARSRTVAGRVGQQNRGFVTRHQALVAVGGRVGEGVEGLGMLDDAANEVQAGVRQTGVAVAGEGVFAVVPDRDMRVHARTVVLHDRLRHERGRLAVGLRDHHDDVLVDLHAVGSGGQGAEGQAELVLGSRCRRSRHRTSRRRT